MNGRREIRQHLRLWLTCLLRPSPRFLNGTGFGNFLILQYHLQSPLMTRMWKLEAAKYLQMRVSRRMTEVRTVDELVSSLQSESNVAVECALLLVLSVVFSRLFSQALKQPYKTPRCFGAPRCEKRTSLSEKPKNIEPRPWKGVASSLPPDPKQKLPWSWHSTNLRMKSWRFKNSFLSWQRIQHLSTVT